MCSSIPLVEVEVNLRPTVSQSVCPGVRRPSETCDQFFFLLEISFRQLWLCYFLAPSLMRGRVCNIPYDCFWAWPEQSPLGRRPAELTAILYCLIWDSPNLEGKVTVFISHRNRVAQLYPQALGSFLWWTVMYSHDSVITYRHYYHFIYEKPQWRANTVNTIIYEHNIISWIK
jgi:hypothetical protein